MNSLGSQLRFESNRGQAEADARFISRGVGYLLSLTTGDARLALRQGMVRLKFVGADPQASMAGTAKLGTVTNYYIGSDPGKWHTAIPNYASVKYSGIYRGIDAVFYGNDGTLEFDFIVRPGVDPGAIQLGLEGIQKLEPDSEGNVVLKLQSGDIQLHKPIAYQEFGGARLPVQSSYILLAGNTLGFEVGDYNRSRTLVIDPLLTYSRYLGRGNFDAGRAIAVDSSQNAYVVGASSDPTSVKGQDAFVAKLNPTGGGGANGAPLYVTYFGGSGFDDAYGVAVDSAGNAYVTGQTQSADFPKTLGAIKTASVSTDAYLAKFNSSGALTYGTYIGGDDGTDVAYAVAVDNATPTLAYVTGSTGATNFPVTAATAYQLVRRGPTDAFVTVLSTDTASLTNLKYSTYFGGSDSDQGNAIAVALDPVAGKFNAYITGATYSFDFPTAGAPQSSPGNGGDAFVSALVPANSGGASLLFSTYLGGPNNEFGNGIAVDSSRNVYVAGQTFGGFPTTAGAYRTSSADWEGFVTKLSPTGNQFLYSTYIGASSFDAAYAISVKPDGTAYVSGETNSSDFPLVDPVQPTYIGDTSAFIAQFDPTGSTLQRSTTLGGTQYDASFGIAVHSASSIAYVTGQTSSTDFPVAGPAGSSGGQSFPAGNSIAAFATAIGPPPPMPPISALNVPATMTSGGSATGTVTLASAAPAGGAVVTLTASAGLTVPTAVVVPGGSATSNSFTITAGNSAFSGSVTAKLGSSTKSANITVSAAPPQIIGFGFTTDSTNSIQSGSIAHGDVTINPSQTGNTVITLSSDNTHVPVPSTVTVPAGSTSVGFDVQTTNVANTVLVTVTARIGSGTPTSTSFNLKGASSAVTGLSFNPSSVPGGTSSTGTITLSGNAPSGGLVVALSSNDSHAQVPMSVTVPQGTSSTTFTVTTTPTSSTVNAMITASANNSSVTTGLTITPPPPITVTSLTLNPTTVTSGDSSTGTVTLSPNAPANGTTVSLSSSTSYAVVQPTVTVPAGQKTATFPVTTTEPPAPTGATITASVGTSSKSATLTINPPARTITGFSFNPGTVNQNQPSTGTVTVSSAVAYATTISLASSPAGAAPSQVTIPPGSSSVSFAANTANPGTYNVTATLTTWAGSSSKSATLTVMAPSAYVPFSTFTADVDINLHRKDDDDSFDVDGKFTLGQASNGIHPDQEDVTLRVASYSTTIPAGSFKLKGAGDRDSDDDDDNDDDRDVVMHWIARYKGTIDGVELKMHIRLKRDGTYRYAASGKGVDFTGTTNPVTVELTIGKDKGVTTDPKARIK